MANDSSTFKQPREPLQGDGTLVFMRRLSAAAPFDAQSFKGEQSQSAIASALANYCRMGCHLSVTPAGFSRGTREPTPCLDNGIAPGYDPDAEYVAGDVIQAAGGIPGLAGKECWRVLESGTGDSLGEPGGGNTSYEVTDCGCAYPRPAKGQLEKNESVNQLAYAPGSDVDEILCDECAEDVQIVVIYPPNDTADGSCKYPVHTWSGFIRQYTPDAITPESDMTAQYTLCRTSSVCKGCFEAASADGTRTAAAPNRTTTSEETTEEPTE